MCVGAFNRMLEVVANLWVYERHFNICVSDGTVVAYLIRSVPSSQWDDCEFEPLVSVKLSTAWYIFRDDKYLGSGTGVRPRFF